MRGAIIALALAIVASSTTAMADPITDYLDKLVPALATTMDAGKAVGTPPSGAKLASANGTWTITLDKPIDVKPALVAWTWGGAYAVSGDVHQRSWDVRISTATIGKDRIATRAPNAGRWAIRVTLAKRPDGDLPKLVAGASPAYNLTKFSGAIASIQIAPRDIDDALDAIALLRKPVMSDIARELGPHDADVGSGIHVLEYKLGGETIHVGTSDMKSVMYVRRGDKDVFRAK